MCSLSRFTLLLSIRDSACGLATACSAFSMDHHIYIRPKYLGEQLAFRRKDLRRFHSYHLLPPTARRRLLRARYSCCEEHRSACSFTRHCASLFIISVILVLCTHSCTAGARVACLPLHRSNFFSDSSL